MGILQLKGKTASNIFDFPSIWCEIRGAWTEAWTEVLGLEPLNATWAASPSVSSASLKYEYGLIKRENETDFQYYPFLNIIGQYIRIRVQSESEPVDVWYGIIQDVQASVQGSRESNPTGVQRFTAYGLEHILDRISVVGSYTDKGYVSRSASFNVAKSKSSIQGNRSNNPTSKSDWAWVFSDEGKTWTALDIIQYLLVWYSEYIEFGLSGQYEYLANIYGEYTFEGLSLKQCIDKLVDRRRGLGWCIRYGDQPYIHIFSTLDSDVAVGDTIFPANSEQYDLRFDDSILTKDVSIEISRSSSYDTIIVQGTPVKVCATFSVAEGSLVPSWLPYVELEYTGIMFEDEEAADKARGRNKYEYVFSGFEVPNNFNWMYDGLYVCPIFDNIAQWSHNDIGYNGWTNKLQFQRWIPFTDENSGDWRAPLVFFADVETGGYVTQETLESLDGNPSLSFRLQDSKLGIHLKGKLPHVMALNTWDEGEHNSKIKPAFDYTKLNITALFETETKPQVHVKLNQESESYSKSLTIDIHDAEFWYIPPGTIIDVLETGEPIRSDGGPVKDDTGKLRAVAALARAWYGRSRGIIRWDERSFRFDVPVGAMVSNASSGWQTESIGTVVTSLMYDFTEVATSLNTGFGELDASVLLDIPGMSDFRSVGRAFNRQSKQIKDIENSLARIPMKTAPNAPSATTDEDAPGAVVDWWCDDFDRGPNNTLGTMWTNADSYFSITNDGSAISTGFFQDYSTSTSSYNKRVASGPSILVADIGIASHSYTVATSEGALPVLGMRDSNAVACNFAVGTTAAPNKTFGIQIYHLRRYTGGYLSGQVDGYIAVRLDSSVYAAVYFEPYTYGQRVNKSGAALSVADEDLLAVANSVIDNQEMRFSADCGLNDTLLYLDNVCIWSLGYSVVGDAPVYYGMRPSFDYRPAVASGEGIVIKSLSARRSIVTDNLPVSAGYGRWNEDDGFIVLSDR